MQSIKLIFRCLQILAKVYMARSDVGYGVRAAALHVWKTLVTNTPRTLTEILPYLMDSIIDLLAGDGEPSPSIQCSRPPDYHLSLSL